jgi:hypothetical protein
VYGSGPEACPVVSARPADSIQDEPDTPRSSLVWLTVECGHE